MTAANNSQFPPRQVGDHVWKGSQERDCPQWRWQLTNNEVAELISAAERYVDGSEADIESILAGPFPLPTLGPKLLALRKRLTHGRGFELISGFPVAETSQALCSAVFTGLGTHLGAARPQNAAGDLLGHVRNVGMDPSDPDVRIYQTNARQTFHTDSADVVGLMCLETAAQGGDSMICSAATIYNIMLDQDPLLAHELFKPVATDRRGEIPPGADPYFTIPVLNWFDNALTVKYQRQYIESAQRLSDAPPLTASYVRALDLFDEIANDPDVHLRMTLEPGDMQFVHNHSNLHDRTSFVDKPGSPRHLLRLWLSVLGDRQLPAVFAQRFGSIEVGARGGITVATN